MHKTPNLAQLSTPRCAQALPGLCCALSASPCDCCRARSARLLPRALYAPVRLLPRAPGPCAPPAQRPYARASVRLLPSWARSAARQRLAPARPVSLRTLSPAPQRPRPPACRPSARAPARPASYSNGQ